MAYIHIETNRSFGRIDERFCLQLGDEIKSRYEQNPYLTVLDVGCGTKAEALILLYQLYPQINVVGIDYRLQPEEGSFGRMKLIKGDLMNMPLKPISDVAYCANVLGGLFMKPEEIGETIAQAVFNISKTLKNNGVAYIDEGIFSGRKEYIEDLMEEIKQIDPDFKKMFQITNNPHLGIFENYLIVRRIK